MSRPSSEADALQNLDVGQAVRIDSWSAGNTARPSTAGRVGRAAGAGRNPAPGEFVIQSVQGSRLVVARKAN